MPPYGWYFIVAAVMVIGACIGMFCSGKADPDIVACSLNYAVDDALTKKALDRLSSPEFLFAGREGQREIIRCMHEERQFPSFIPNSLESLPAIKEELTKRIGNYDTPQPR
jgi:hypothetical protein